MVSQNEHILNIKYRIQKREVKNSRTTQQQRLLTVSSGDREWEGGGRGEMGRRAERSRRQEGRS